MILVYIAAAFARPVESDSKRVRLVVIFRKPVRSCSLDLAPRFGTIMVSPCKYMMEAQRHHVVHSGFARRHHHVQDRFCELCF